MEEHKICSKCGRTYIYLCRYCRQSVRLESIEFLMDKHGLNDEAIIVQLAHNVFVNASDAALAKAIKMKGMIPPDKIELGGMEGGPIELAESRERLTVAVTRALIRIREGEGSGESEPEGDTNSFDGDGQPIQKGPMVVADQ